jgi:hypothetical protein
MWEQIDEPFMIAKINECIEYCNTKVTDSEKQQQIESKLSDITARSSQDWL